MSKSIVTNAIEYDNAKMLIYVRLQYIVFFDKSTNNHKKLIKWIHQSR